MINRALRGLIRVYQLLLSPLLSLLDVAGGGCRFEPSCSRYCMQALAEHGTWRGLWLGTKRLARCAPWGGTGLDPVPPAAGRRTAFTVPPAPCPPPGTPPRPPAAGSRQARGQQRSGQNPATTE